MNQVTRRMRRHTFCSDACETEYHIARQAAVRRKSTDLEKECDSCGDRFTASRSDARFCSNACRQKAYRSRKAGRTGSA